MDQTGWMCATQLNLGPRGSDEKIPFYISGAGYNAVENDLVCPAWMIPPVATCDPNKHPLLILDRSETRTLDVKVPGDDTKTLPLKYEIACLKFNADEEPKVLVKGLHGRAYMQLERQHLNLGNCHSLDLLVF